MKGRVVVPALLLLGGLLRASGDWVLNGRVGDLSGQPLADAAVQVRGAGLSCRSGADGAFQLTLPGSISQVHLQVTLTGYRAQVLRVARGGLPRGLQVRLAAQPLLHEEVTVTALNEAERAAAVPFAQSVVGAPAIREKLPENVVEAGLGVPGLQPVGKGGVAVTPGIRGLARRRVLVLLDGARLVSDRSAGTSAAFVPNELIERIEIVRSAAAVLYGSDAIGGVLQVFTGGRRPGAGGLGDFQLSAGSASGRLSGALRVGGPLGPLQTLLFVQHARSGDYRAPGGTVLRSGYEYTTTGLALAWSHRRREASLRLLASWGHDVGKPERANDPQVFSYYPSDRNLVLNLAWREREIRPGLDLHLEAFTAPSRSQLRKVKRRLDQTEESRTAAFDFGWRARLRKAFSPALSAQLGVDGFGRRNVRMENASWRGGEPTDHSVPLADGRRDDVGFYATVDYAGLKFFDLVGGARLTLLRRTATSDGRFSRRSGTAPAFFAGLTRHFGPNLTLFVNAGTAYRVPSLSEAFYTGISGRSTIRGNPALEPEKSLNLDAGLKWGRRRLFVGAYLFRTRVRGLIEKYPLADGSYTYANLLCGVVQGVEAEFQWLPRAGIELFGNGWLYRGRDSGSAAPLNDVPAARLLLGGRVWRGRFWAEVSGQAMAAQRDPGPAEVAVSSWRVTDLKAGWFASGRLTLTVRVSNLFDRLYYANADPDTPPARGIELAAGISGSF